MSVQAELPTADPGKADGTADTSRPGKGFRRGTHRLVAPEQTWQAIRPLLPQLGITRISDITGLDDLGIPVYVAVRPASATLAVSQGKGVTHELARVSAAMEIIEFAHAEDVPRAALHGPASEVLGGQYDIRDLQLARGSLVSDSVVLGWLPGRTVAGNQPTWAPREYVQVSNAFRRSWAPPLFETSTNGLASGNSVDEAALHGLYELIERDCLADLAAAPRNELMRLHPSAVTDADCQWLIERLVAADNWFEIIDVTNRFGVPCYYVSIWSESFPLVITGTGCHLDPAVALNRALTEAAQSRLAIIAGTRESVPEQVYLLQHMRHERPQPLGPHLPVTREMPLDDSADSIAADLLAVARKILATGGSDPIIVDISRGYDGIAVTKTIVPGLRFDPLHGSTERIRSA
jgi:ribosomal protein S12 methylthiotransferase accessory factor